MKKREGTKSGKQDRRLIGGLLRHGVGLLREAGVGSAPLDAELFLAEALGKQREYALSHGEEILASSVAERFESMLKRRAKHEPVAYILGRKEFYGFEFLVNKHVLIPRPKTEELVEQAREVLKQWVVIKSKIPHPKFQKIPKNSKFQIPNSDILVIDVGTGSGVLAITVQKLFPDVAVLAIDVSKRALQVAMSNAKKHEIKVIRYSSSQVIKDLNGVHFLQSDLLLKLGKVHFRNILILANLPYVPTREIATLEKDIKDYEPKRALDGGHDGLDLFRRLATQIVKKCKGKNVNVVWECEEGQEKAMRQIFLGTEKLPSLSRKKLPL